MEAVIPRYSSPVPPVLPEHSNPSWAFSFLTLCIAALLASAAFPGPGNAVPLTRQQAVQALLAPGSGVPIDTTVSSVWSPYRDFGAGANYRGLLPAGSSADPVSLGGQPFPGPGMPVPVSSYFFWVDDLRFAFFEHPVRFVLLDANVASPTVANGGITITAQGWWPVLTRPGALVDTVFQDIDSLVTNLPPGFDNPQGLVAGRAYDSADTTLLPAPSIVRSPAQVQAGNSCGLIFSGDTDGRFSNDATEARNMMHNLGVSDSRIKTANKGFAATRETIRTTIGAMCALQPPCDKVFLYFSTHGSKDKKIRLADGLFPADTLCQILGLVAHKGVKICMVGDCCFAEGLMDPKNWGFPDSSVIFISSDSTHAAWGAACRDSSGKKCNEGLFTYALARCVEALPGQGLPAAFDWVYKRHPCFVARVNGVDSMLYPAGPATGGGVNPGPKRRQVLNISAPGHHSRITVPDGMPSVSFEFEPGTNPAFDASVHIYNATTPAATVLVKSWDWNMGLTRSLGGIPGGGCYEFVSDANHSPVRASFTYPSNPAAGSPSSLPSTLPAFSLGWVDQNPSEFNLTLGQGGGNPPPPFQVQPELSLNTVPGIIGTNYYPYLDVGLGVQIDQSRPWLYVNGNPSQGFNGPTYLQVAAAGITDAAGTQVQALPLQLLLFQGATTLFQSVLVQSDGAGHFTSPPVSFGQIKPQPFAIRIQPLAPQGAPSGRGASPQSAGRTQPAGGPGRLFLDAVVVSTLAGGTAGVDDGAPGPRPLTLSLPNPNPFRLATSVSMTIDRLQPVRARIFDLQGALVRTLVDMPLTPGPYTFQWDGRSDAQQRMPSGVYFLRVEMRSGASTRKVALVH